MKVGAAQQLRHRRAWFGVGDQGIRNACPGQQQQVIAGVRIAAPGRNVGAAKWVTGGLSPEGFAIQRPTQQISVGDWRPATGAGDRCGTGPARRPA